MKVRTGVVAVLMAIGTLGAPTAAHGATPDVELINDCWPTDLGDPVLDSETATPSAVDVTDGPRTVEVTVTAHDEGGPGPATGVTWAKAYLNSHNGPEITLSAELHQDAPDGAWTGTITVPQWVVGGRWMLGLALRDAAGNSSEYGSSMPEGDTDAIDITAFDQANTLMLEVADYRIRRSHLDTRRHARRQTFTVVGNERNGPPIVGGLVLAVDPAEPALGRLVQLHHAHGLVWKGSTMIPRWSGTGTWVTDPILVDASGHTGGLDTPPSIPVTFSVTSQVDRDPPSLEGLSLTPEPLDAEDGTARLRVDASVADTQSGVGAVAINLDPPYAKVYDGESRLTRRHLDLHPVGAGSRTAGLPPAMRRSSEVRRLIASYGAPTTAARRTTDAGAQRWTATVPWSACWAVSGSWRVRAHTQDVDGNQSRLTTSALRRAGLASSLRVRQPDRVPLAMTADPVDRDTNYVDFTLSELARGLDATSASLHDITADGHPEVPGTWTCQGRRHQPRDCETGPFFFARYTIDAPQWDGHAYQVVLDRGSSQSFTDLAGNPCAGETCTPGFYS